MSNIKFIHCADLHLGSVVNVSNSIMENFHRKIDFNIEKAFEKIIDLAIREKVDFVLLSGDIFDTENLDVRADKIFLAECMKLKENSINIYIIAGNHDPLDEKKYLFNLPSNVYVFDGDRVNNVYYEKNSKKVANIIGVSYKQKYLRNNLIESFNGLREEGVINIAMLHTSLENDEKYASCTIDQLKKSRIEYWALGHIHKNRILNNGVTTIVYPGIPQGRDFGEQHCGGVYLVEYEDQNLKSIEYKEVNLLIYKDINISITGDIQKENIELLDCLCDFIINEIRSNLKFTKDDNVNFIRVNICSELKIDILESMKQKDLLEYIEYINNIINRRNENFIIGYLTYSHYPKKEEVNIEEYILKLILEEVDILKNRIDLDEEIGEIWTSREERMKETVFLLDEESKEEIISEALKNIINQLS